MQKKIAHLVYSLGCGGLEQVIVNLINNSSDYKATHVIVTLTEDQALYTSITQACEIYCLHKGPGNDLSSHIRLFKLLRKIRPDVINTYNFGTIEYNITAALAGVPRQIHSDHGLGGDPSSGKSKKRNLLRKFISRLLKNYVVVSPDLEKWASETLKINSKKLQLVFNGVDLEKYKTQSEKRNIFTFCTVGRCDPIKNQAMLIQAYHSALISVPELKNTELHIAGDGPIFNELQKLVDDLRASDNIKMLGYRSDVNDIMAYSHVFVLSSLYEAMPLTALEAMSCELPVICTKVGGTEHLLSDEEAWLVPSDNIEAMKDALVFAFQNYTIALGKGQKGRQKVSEKYSIDAMVSVYMDLYGCEK